MSAWMLARRWVWIGLATGAITHGTAMAQPSQAAPGAITNQSGTVVSGSTIHGGVHNYHFHAQTSAPALLPGSGPASAEPRVDNSAEDLALLVNQLRGDAAFLRFLVEFSGATGNVNVPAAERQLDAAVEAGSGLAAMVRSLAYQNGYWGSKNLDEARRLMLLAADRGVAGAQNFVQSQYWDGSNGYPKDRRKSTTYLERLVDNENATRHWRGQGALWLGNRYILGEDHPRDVCRGLRLTVRAAGYGNTAAMVNLGHEREHQNRCQPVDAAAALQWFRQAADAGDTGGAEQAGRMLYFGLGTARDFMAALRYNLQARSANANGLVALTYAKGLHNTQRVPDTPQALAYARRAAEQGHTNSMINIGLMHWYGLGLPHNPNEAFRWYSKAVDAGDRSAVIHQAIAVMHGCVSLEHLPRWLDELTQLTQDTRLTPALRAVATYHLGQIHLYGLGGVPRDERKALNLLQAACQADHAAACALLKDQAPNPPVDTRTRTLLERTGPLLQTSGEACRARVTQPSANPDVFP